MSSFFLFEAGFWGLPHGCLAKEPREIHGSFMEVLNEFRLTATRVRFWLSSRRLAFLLEEVSPAQKDQISEIRGPKAAIAFDSNNHPTPAATGFAAKLGIDLRDLFIKEADDGKFVFGKKKEKGQPLSALIPTLLPRFLKEIPWAISPWQKDNFFPQPPFYICVMLDDQVVPFSFDGVASGDQTGFFESGNLKATKVPHAREFARIMSEYGVQPLPQDRLKIIESQSQVISTEGVTLRKESSILEKIAFQCEVPGALILDIPTEIFNLPGKILFKILGDSPNYLPFESSKGGFISKVAGFLDGRQAGPEETLLRADALKKRFSHKRLIWEADLRKSIDQRSRELRNYYGSGSRSCFEEALEVSRLSQEIAKALDLKINLDYLDSAVRLLFSEKSCEILKIYPELRGSLISDIAESNGATAETLAILRDCENLFAVKDFSQKTIEGAVISLAFNFDRLCQTTPLPSASRKEAADRVLQIIISKNFRIDLSHFIRTFTVKKIFDREFWIENFSQRLSREGLDKKQYEWLLEGESFSPAVLYEAVRTWPERPTSELNIFSSLFQRIMTKLPATAGMVSPTELPVTAAEISLNQKLERLETQVSLDFKTVFENLMGCRVDIEACLMDLPAVIEETQPGLAVRTALLRRATKQIARIPGLNLSIENSDTATNNKTIGG